MTDIVFVIDSAVESKYGNKITLYRVDFEPDIAKLIPRVPKNFLTDNGYEDSKTKRVCFSTSIDKCLMGMSCALNKKELYVYKTEIEESKIYSPTIKEVPDSLITDEKWVLKTVDVSCIGKIIVSDSDEEPKQYKAGNNIFELYPFTYKWVDRYITGNIYTHMPMFL